MRDMLLYCSNSFHWLVAGIALNVIAHVLKAQVHDRSHYELELTHSRRYGKVE
jgi:hypothetical protein